MASRRRAALTRLAAKRDGHPPRRGADIASMIREELPNARNVRTTLEGEGTPRTFGEAYRAEIKSILSMRAESVFTVIADADTPRPDPDPLPSTSPPARTLWSAPRSS